MPRVRLLCPSGYSWEIATRQTETLLRAWFDEVLPWTFIPGRPGIDDFETLWPRIEVNPMWAWKLGMPTDPDWLCDGRVLGRWNEFQAKDGETGLKALLALRQELERELCELSDRER